ILQNSADQTPTQRERLFWQLGFQNILTNPGWYLLLELKKLVYWVLPLGASVRTTSMLHQISGILFYVAILIPALLGFRALSAEPRMFLAGIALSFTFMI